MIRDGALDVLLGDTAAEQRVPVRGRVVLDHDVRAEHHPEPGPAHGERHVHVVCHRQTVRLMQEAHVDLDQAASDRHVRAAQPVDVPVVVGLEVVAPDDASIPPDQAGSPNPPLDHLAVDPVEDPPAHRSDSVLVLDAASSFELDALHVQALELALRRCGLRTLTLAADVDPARLGRALRALEPSALVLAGRGASLDAVGRLVYAARSGGRRVEDKIQNTTPDGARQRFSF